MTKEDIKGYTSALMPTSVVTNPTLLVGGAPSYSIVGSAVTGGTVIGGVTIGEVFCVMPSTILGGGTRYQSAKWFVTNTHATDDAQSMYVWGMSLDDSPSGPFTCGMVSDASGDGATHVGTFVGFDPSNNPYSEQVAGNGLTQVNTFGLFNKLVRFVNVDSITGAPKGCVGNRTIFAGTTPLGVVLPTFESITSEVTWGLVGTQNDSGTTVDANTPPVGITLAKPRTFATAIAFASGGSLAHLVGQGLWELWAVPELCKATADFQIPKQFDGNSFS